MSAERIANLQQQLKDAQAERQAAESRYKALTANMLAPVANDRLRALGAAYGAFGDTQVPRVLKLLSVLQDALDIADPLKGAPMSDTARVGHPELTSVEAAVVTYAGARSNVRWLGDELEQFIRRAENRLYPDDVRGEKPKAPQCWKRPCRGVRGRIGDRYCGACGKAYEEDEEAVA